MGMGISLSDVNNVFLKERVCVCVVVGREELEEEDYGCGGGPREAGRPLRGR
jgi:hypothetical protein